MSGVNINHPLSSEADVYREKAWRKRQQLHRRRALEGDRGVLTNGDLEELKGCIELDFAFHDATKKDSKFNYKMLPALELLNTVNKQYQENKSNPKDQATTSEASKEKHDTLIFDAGDGPKMVKHKIKQWAKAVTCFMKQYTPKK